LANHFSLFLRDCKATPLIICCDKDVKKEL
jgi:hypothetical protein